jgi:hypothetical protein
VESEVSLEDFQDFISALEDKSSRMNHTNFAGLSELLESVLSSAFDEDFQSCAITTIT